MTIVTPNDFQQVYGGTLKTRALNQPGGATLICPSLQANNNIAGIASGSTTSAAKLTDNTYVLYDETAGRIWQIEYDDSIPVVNLNSTVVVGATRVRAIERLSENLIALASIISGPNAFMQAYSYTPGTDTWALEGQYQFPLASNSPPAQPQTIANLGVDDRICVWERNTEGLRTYDWNGTTFVPVGNKFALSLQNFDNVCRLSTNRVVTARRNIGDPTTELRAFDFDGTDYSQVGNATAVSVSPNYTQSLMSYVADNTILMFNPDVGTFDYYEFDGSDFVGLGLGCTTPSTTAFINYSMCLLSGSTLGSFDEVHRAAVWNIQ